MCPCINHDHHTPHSSVVHGRYGALTGLSKKMIRQRHGVTKFTEWRRSYNTRPPPVSSFSMFYPGNEERYTNYVQDVPISIFESFIRVREGGYLVPAATFSLLTHSTDLFSPLPVAGQRQAGNPQTLPQNGIPAGLHGMPPVPVQQRARTRTPHCLCSFSSRSARSLTSRIPSCPTPSKSAKVC
jgi:hypothetical protein